MVIKAIYKVHRWAGVAVAILMVTWLASGAVLLYCGQPMVGRSEQLSHADNLNVENGWLSVGRAWQLSANAHPDSKIASARLLRVGDLPIWQVIDEGGKAYSLSALTGALQDFSPLQAEEIAQHWEHRPAQGDEPIILYEDTQVAPSSLRNYWDLGPFRRVAVHDLSGTELLVSSHTGEVIQASTRVDRGLYYAGSWLHFLRFLDYPGSGDLRRNVLLWTVGIALAASLTGVIIGWLKWRPAFLGYVPYPNGQSQPYRSFNLKWHFWGGLVGGLFALLWAFSGFLSGNPWQMFSQAAPSKAEYNKFYGGALTAEQLAWLPDKAAVPGGAVEVELRHLGRGSTVVAFSGQGERTLLDLPQISHSVPQSAVVDAALRLVPGAKVAGSELLSSYDSYYYLYHNRDIADKPLPVWLVKLDDAAATWVYVDPVDGRLLARLDSSRRLYRWLFSSVHRWDFPSLYDRPLWDVWQLFWIAVNLLMAGTSVVLAWRWLRRKQQVAAYRLSQLRSGGREEDFA